MAQDDLTDFIEDVCGDSHLRVEDDLGDGFVRLRSSEAERRQAKDDIRSTEDIVIEMLRNSRDASACSIFVATWKSGDKRCLTLIDDGEGIPEHMRELVFEPRVTSKLDSFHMDTWGIHGRGMALYSIKQNAQKASVLDSAVGGGSAIHIETDTSRLSEKTDQSSLPEFIRTDDGTLVVRGPRNINRIIAEFSYFDRSSVTVYCGSPVDIAATLYAFGCATLSSRQRAFSADLSCLPLCKRLATCADPKQFADVAEKLGLPLSERSARRIIDGDIAGLDDVLGSLHVHQPASATQRGKKHAGGDQRGLKLSAADRADFTDKVKRAYGPLADSYYLEADVEPEIRVSKEFLTVRVPLRKID